MRPLDIGCPRVDCDATRGQSCDASRESARRRRSIDYAVVSNHFHAERVALADSVVPARRVGHWLADLDPLGDRLEYTDDEKAGADEDPRPGWIFCEDALVPACAALVPKPGEPAAVQWCLEATQAETDLLIASELARHARPDERRDVLAMAGLEAPVEIARGYEGLGTRRAGWEHDARCSRYSIARGGRHSDPTIRMMQRRVEPLIERAITPFAVNVVHDDRTVRGGRNEAREAMARPIHVGRTRELRGTLERDVWIAMGATPSSSFVPGYGLRAAPDGRAIANIDHTAKWSIGTCVEVDLKGRRALVRRAAYLPRRPCWIVTSRYLNRAGWVGGGSMYGTAEDAVLQGRDVLMIDTLASHELAANLYAVLVAAARLEYSDEACAQAGDEHGRIVGPLATL